MSESHKTVIMYGEAYAPFLESIQHTFILEECSLPFIARVKGGREEAQIAGRHMSKFRPTSLAIGF